MGPEVEGVEAGVGDVETLYRRLARRLERIVRFDIRVSEAVIEDACQFAWCRLVDHHDRVRRDTALPWLATTAVREACRLSRRERGALPLEAIADGPGDGVMGPFVPGPHDLVEQRERLGELGGLPVRQQRLMWLQGAGFSYTEMASREGCTRRTVERQVLRARRSVRRTSAVSTE